MPPRQSRTIISRGHSSSRDESTVTDRHAPLNPRLGRSPPIPRELAGGLSSLSHGSRVPARARPAYVICGCVRAEPIPGSFSRVVSWPLFWSRDLSIDVPSRDIDGLDSIGRERPRSIDRSFAESRDAVIFFFPSRRSRHKLISTYVDKQFGSRKMRRKKDVCALCRTRRRVRLRQLNRSGCHSSNLFYFLDDEIIKSIVSKRILLRDLFLKKKIEYSISSVWRSILSHSQSAKSSKKRAFLSFQFKKCDIFM